MPFRLLPVVVAVALALPVGYALAGGASYEPHRVGDPCRFEPPATTSQGEALQAVLLDGAARAACEIGVSREVLVLALGDPRSRAALGRSLPGALDRGLRAALAAGTLDAGTAGLALGLLDIAAVPDLIDAVLASAPPCRPFALAPTGEPAALTSRLLADGLRRAACARGVSLASMLVAVAPGAETAPDAAVALRDGIRAAVPEAGLPAALAVVIDEGARAVDPLRLIGLLRDGTDACAPLAWARPEGQDQIGAQLALRTLVAGACAFDVALAPLAAALAEADALAAIARSAGIDDDRAQAVVREALAAAVTDLERDDVIPGVGADALRALVRIVPADRLLLVAQGTDDPCLPLVWQATDGVTEFAAELALYAVQGAACATARSALAIIEQIDDPELVEPLRAGLLTGIDAAERAGAIGAIRAFALREAARRLPLGRALELAGQALA